MFDLDKWKEIWATLRSNRLRTFLTAFGVFWGILMLILMLGFASSMEVGIRHQMGGMATNMLWIWGQQTTEAYDGLPVGRDVQFITDDIAPVCAVPGVEHCAPRISLGGFMKSSTVRHESKAGNYTVFGDYSTLAQIQAFTFDAGRFINQRDIAEQRKVAVIGKQVRDELLPADADPLGQYIQIRGVYFQVVGVTHTLRSGREGERDAQTIYVPFTTMRAAFNTGNHVTFFALTAKAGLTGTAVQAAVTTTLKERHHIAPTDELAVGGFNMFEIFSKLGMLFLAIRVLGWVVGVFTLAAGVIGVSNIMLITVKERTKEIGVRKALGATPFSIVSMVMKEAVVLTAASGLFGVSAGVGLTAASGWLIAKFPDLPFGPPQLPLSTALFAVGVIVVAGAFAGLMPASHASRIKPIEALRAE